MSEAPSPIVRPFGIAELRPLLESPGPIRVTLNLPLSSYPHSAQNVVRTRHAVETALKRLDAWPRAAASRGAIADLLSRVQSAIAHAPSAGSLSVLLDTERIRVLACAAELTPEVSVGECFRLRPVLQALGSDARYRVLGASPHHLAIFEGDSRGLERVSCGARPVAHDRTPGSDPSHFHRVLGRAITHAFRGDHTPLVLVADLRHQAGLRAACRVPGLLPTGVAASPDRMTPAELHASAWPLVRAELRRRRDEARARFELARNVGKALSFLDDVAAAAVEGRVRRLWLDAELSLPGHVHVPSGRVLSSESDGDVLDSLAGIVIERGGEVHVVDPHELPSVTGVAAELN